jgi:enamine deaminase RidA (YjgF/YER057c/UK114 family)
MTDSNDVLLLRSLPHPGRKGSCRHNQTVLGPALIAISRRSYGRGVCNGGQPATQTQTRSQCFDRQMTSVELVRSTALTDTVPYAYAAVTPPGRLVFTAGACPLDQDGAVVAPGDVAAQAQQVMANLAVALGAAGADLTDVAKTSVYVASSSRADLVTAWQVVRNVFGDHDAPSTLLGVAALGYPGQVVEVEAVAVTGGGLARS